MRTFAETQLCMSVSARCQPLSFSPTSSQMRSGLGGFFGIRFSAYSHAPCGDSGFVGDCWFTYVPEYVRIRWYKSGRNQPIVKAHEPPELPPIVARPSGLDVNFTLHSFAARGSTSVSMKLANLSETVSYSSPRSLPFPSPPPELTMTAIITGTFF